MRRFRPSSMNKLMSLGFMSKATGILILCAVGAWGATAYFGMQAATYHASGTCSAGQTGDCREYIRTTIEDQYRASHCTGGGHRGGHCSYHAVIVIEPALHGVFAIKFDPETIPHPEFSKGHHVTVEYWNGNPVVVTGQSGTILMTTANPDEQVASLRKAAIIVSLAALAALLMVILLLRRTWRSRHQSAVSLLAPRSSAAARTGHPGATDEDVLSRG